MKAADQRCRPTERRTCSNTCRRPEGHSAVSAVRTLVPPLTDNTLFSVFECAINTSLGGGLRWALL